MQLFRTLAIGLAAAALSFAADIDGNWTGELNTQHGPMQITMALKADGENLTGTITSQMGGQAIKEGKIKGGDLTWFTILERDGNSMKIMNKAKVTGSEMKITVTVEGRDISMEYTAKKTS
jgi:hypothetical protein